MATNDSKVKIDLELNAKQIQQQITNLNKDFMKIGNTLRKQQMGTTGTKMSDKKVARLSAVHQKLDAALTKSKKSLADTQQKLKGLDSATQGAQKNTKGYTNVLKRINKENPFPGFAMSVMFAGMAIKRVMDSIMKSTVQTFNRVMATMFEADLATTKLAGAWEYLKFTIGSAMNSVIEAILPILLPLIMAIADWVSENELLIGAIIVIASVLGLFLMILGQVGLAWTGLSGMFTFIAAYVLPALTSAFGGILAFLSGPVLAIIALVIIAVMLNIGNIRGFIVTTFNSIMAFLTRFLKGFFKMISGIWMVLKGIWNGDTLMMIKGLLKIFQGFGEMCLAVFDGVAVSVYNIFALMWNLLVDLTVSSSIRMLEILWAVAAVIDKVAGTNLVSRVNAAIKTMENVKAKVSIDYMSLDEMESAREGLQSQQITNIFNIDIDKLESIEQLKEEILRESDE